MKQKFVAKKVVNGMSVSKAMVEAGYSKTTARNVDKVTKAKGFQELMEKYIPDKLLMEKHKELLTVPKKVRKFMKGELEYEYEEVDSNAIGKGLDMAYKLKGSYSAEKHEITIPKPLMDV